MNERIRITTLWLVSSGLLLLLIVISAVKNPEHARTSLAWLAPSVLPGVGLIVGLWVSTNEKIKEAVNVSSGSIANKLCFYFCIFYFVILAFSYLAYPFVNMKISDWLELSQLWLALIQAPTLALLSYIFKN